MKRTLLVFCALGVLALTTSCNQAPPAVPDKHDADIQAIKDNETQWNKDYVAKDVDKLLAHYTDDAVLMTPGEPQAKGKDAIRAGMQELAGDSAFALTFQADQVDVAKSGDMAYVEGSYNLTVTDPKTKKPYNDKGNYVTVYTKQADGSWKAVSDIASSSTQPATGPTPTK